MSRLRSSAATKNSPAKPESWLSARLRGFLVGVGSCWVMPAHLEGGERRWCVATSRFLGKGGKLAGLKGHEVRWSGPDAGGRSRMTKVKGSEFTMEADLVLLAMGFTQPEHNGLLDSLGVEYDGRGNVLANPDLQTSVAGIYAAGDVQTGAWLVVRAIAAGRRMAASVSRQLVGKAGVI